MKDQRHCTGEEVHRGDRFVYAGKPATIVLVVDREEFPADEPEESREWWRAEEGSRFLMRQDDRTHFFLDEADEDLVFVSGTPAGAGGADPSPVPIT